MPTENNTQSPEVEGVEVDSGGMLASLDKATIDVQITTARAYPRSIDKFRKDALALATSDETTARSMFYVVPRAGKNIEGASVRLAEVIGSCWGNLRYGSRIVDIGETFVTAQGMALDLEKNVAITLNVQRRIRDKYNRRYTDDMIGTTANAAMSIALRNAILRVVPGWKGIYEEAKKISTGKGQTMEQRQNNAIRAFNEIGATTPDVLRVLKRRGVPDITIDDLITLNGIRTAIQDGETTWRQILDDLPQSEDEVETRLKRDFKTGFDATAETIVGDRKPHDVEVVARPAHGQDVAPDPTLTEEEQALLRASAKAAGFTAKQFRVWLFENFAPIEDEGDVLASQVTRIQAALEAHAKR